MNERTERRDGLTVRVEVGVMRCGGSARRWWWRRGGGDGGGGRRALSPSTASTTERSASTPTASATCHPVPIYGEASHPSAESAVGKRLRVFGTYRRESWMDAGWARRRSAARRRRRRATQRDPPQARCAGTCEAVLCARCAAVGMKHHTHLFVTKRQDKRSGRSNRNVGGHRQLWGVLAKRKRSRTRQLPQQGRGGGGRGAPLQRVAHSVSVTSEGLRAVPGETPRFAALRRHGWLM